MNTLETNANTKNFETGYLMSGTPGNYSYTFQSGDPGDPFMNFTGITQTIDGYIHSHFNGTLSIFSPQDIRAIYLLHQAGKINGLATFTAGVVTSQGSAYLLKVDDVINFLSFEETF